MNSIKIVLLSEDAKIPTRGSPYSAGYDLYSPVNAIVPANGKKLIDLDIAVGLNYGTYGRMAPRSGLATKYMLAVGAGVVDCDYTGPLKVLLFNHSNQDYFVNKWDRIAQLIVTKIEMSDIEIVNDLSPTLRGSNGFGSTGDNVQRVDPTPYKRSKSYNWKGELVYDDVTQAFDV